MSALLTGIKQNKFLVIGRAGMDFFPHPAGTRTEDATEFRSGLGGSAANTAAGICRFGGSADLVTCVSDDSIGRYCLNQLDHYGVGHKYVRSVGGEFRNSLAVYESRVADHQTVIYRNGAADFEMSLEDVEALDYKAYGALITAGTVFAAEPSRSAAFRAFDLARDAGLPIIFDIDYRPYSWPSPQVAQDVLSRAGDLSDMIVGNDEEFGFMAGDIAKGQTKAKELSETNAEIVIYKMGEHGAVTYLGDQTIETGIYKVEALKPTGAGDSFMAGLMAAIAAGFELKDAIHRGSACAAIVVGKPGCAPALPDQTELDAFLNTHPGPSTV